MSAIEPDYTKEELENYHVAIFYAAVEKHPGWRLEGREVIQVEGAPDPDALTEWFYDTYPSEAKAIYEAGPDAWPHRLS